MRDQDTVTKKQVFKMDEKALTEHIYKLFGEFSDAYRSVWDRMDDNAKFYQSDDWTSATMGQYVNTKSDQPFDPKPVTPTIFSTVENLKADILQEFPEAIFKARTTEDFNTAEIMTQVYRAVLKECDYKTEFSKCIHDLLVNCFCVQEAVWDNDAAGGMGDLVLRHWSPRNFMCDPLSEDLQEGRACFKFTKVTMEWARTHYPDKWEEMKADADAMIQQRANVRHDDIDNKLFDDQSCMLLEYWYRDYDPDARKYSVHMVTCCGGKIVENSKEKFPKGIYAHGQYPFNILSMYPVSGSPVGFCIVDVLKKPQAHANKLEQITFRNIYAASQIKVKALAGLYNREDLLDWTNPIIEMQQQGAVESFQVPALPAYVPQITQLTHEGMKENSGQNQFGRGETAHGVTAATAIMALQKAAGKRSMLIIDNVYKWFERATRQAIETIREFYKTDRYFMISGENGTQSIGTINGELMIAERDGKKVPIDFALDINPQAQNPYNTLVMNEFAVQLMQAGAISPYAGISMMDFADKQHILSLVQEKENYEQNMAQMQQVIQQLQQQLQQTGAELKRAQGSEADAGKQMNAMQEYMRMIGQEGADMSGMNLQGLTPQG